MQLEVRGPRGAGAKLINPGAGVTAHHVATAAPARRGNHSVHLHGRSRGQTAVLLQQRPRSLVRRDIEQHRRQSGGPPPKLRPQPPPRQRGVANRASRRPSQCQMQTATPPVNRQPAREIHHQRARRSGGRTKPRQHRVRIPRPIQVRRVTRDIAVQQHRRLDHPQRRQVCARRHLHAATPRRNIPGYE